MLAWANCRKRTARLRPPRRDRLGERRGLRGEDGGGGGPPLGERDRRGGERGGWKGVGNDRGGAGGGSQFFTSLRMRLLLYPTNVAAALTFLKAS